jgi:hypothetical protein
MQWQLSHRSSRVKPLKPRAINFRRGPLRRPHMTKLRDLQEPRNMFFDDFIVRTRYVTLDIVNPRSFYVTTKTGSGQP